MYINVHVLYIHRACAGMTGHCYVGQN